MRILYLQTFPLWGSGSGTYARYLASELGKRHKVGIVAPDDRIPMRTKVYEVDMPFKVAFTGHPEWPKCKFYRHLSPNEIILIYKAFLSSTQKAVLDFKPDILHVHHAYPFSWVAEVINAFYGLNFVVTIHGSELPTAEDCQHFVNYTRGALMKAKKIIPNSFWTQDWFVKVFGEKFEERGLIKVITPGVSLERYNPDLSSKSIEEEHGIGKDEMVVVFVGKLTKYKGVKYLLKAAEKLPARVFIIGQGPEEDDLKRRAKKMKLKNVHFIDHTADTRELNKFYNRADVFVAPSIWDEPLGLVVLEAMACRTPVVVTKKGGLSLMVKEGKNGYFIRPRNSTQIVEKVCKLLDNGGKRKKMGKDARKMVEKKFCWEKIAKEFEGVYKKHLLPDKKHPFR